MTKSDQAKFDAIESEVRQLRADNAELVRMHADEMEDIGAAGAGVVDDRERVATGPFW